MKETLRGIGFVLHVPLLMALVSLGVCAAFGEWYGAGGFLLTGLASLLPGQLLIYLTRDAEPLKLRHALYISASAWLLVCLLCSIPFMWTAFEHPLAATAVFKQFSNALFESISGITSTGLSVLVDVESLPRHLQWWRSLTEWVGGIGLVVLLLTVLPITRSALDLYQSEGRDQKLYPTVRSTVKAIWLLFLLFTALGTGGLLLAGEPPWQALNHAMAAISTGGFSITNDSIGSSSTAAKIVYLPIMIVGAMSFMVHYQLLTAGNWRAWLWKTAEIKAFWAIMLGGALLLTFENRLSPTPIAVIDSVFLWVSAATTTGFATTGIAAWPHVSIVLLILVMLVGAMAGSTGSGIKVLRLVILLKGFVWSLRLSNRSPRQIVRFDWNGANLDSGQAGKMVRQATLLAVAYLLLWLLCSLMLLHALPPETLLQDAFFEIASAQANVGLSVGITSAELSGLGKTALCIAMYVGRLELVPAMALLVAVLQSITGRVAPRKR